MTLLIIPGLFFLLAAPMPGPPASALADFSRISRALHKQIALVEADGTRYDGVLTAADGDQLSVKLASSTKIFPRANVVSADRQGDGRIDGVVKGALFGFVISAFASQGCDDTTRCHPWRLVAATAGIGYWFDAEETHSRPLYRAPGQPKAVKPKPALSLSVRF
jgi:hypothetical protein